MNCWDCKTETDDYVMESRQVSGGDGVVYAGVKSKQPKPRKRKKAAKRA